MISAAEINNIVGAYAKTPAGKAKSGAYLKDLRSKDGTTASGQQVIGLKTMCRLADDLVRMVKDGARSSGAADAIMDEINSLSYTYTDLGDGQYRFDFKFTADTHRDSMMPKLYPMGIDNIIALFNAGYVAENPKWENISGPPHMRQTLGFMQDAIERFKSKYGSKYAFQIELNPIYTDGNWVVTPLSK